MSADDQTPEGEEPTTEEGATSDATVSINGGPEIPLDELEDRVAQHLDETAEAVQDVVDEALGDGVQEEGAGGQQRIAVPGLKLTNEVPGNIPEGQSVKVPSFAEEFDDPAYGQIERGDTIRFYIEAKVTGINVVDKLDADGWPKKTVRIASSVIEYAREVSAAEAVVVEKARLIETATPVHAGEPRAIGKRGPGAKVLSLVPKNEQEHEAGETDEGEEANVQPLPPETQMMVEVEIAAGEVQAGDELGTEDGWVLVRGVSLAGETVRITLDDGTTDERATAEAMQVRRS